MRTKRAGSSSSCDIVSMVERRASAGRATIRLFATIQAALLALALLALAEGGGHAVKPTAPASVIASMD